MRKIWSKTEVTSLPTRDLLTIVASTNPEGDLWIELGWASNELDRRRAARPADVAHEEQAFIAELVA